MRRACVTWDVIDGWPFRRRRVNGDVGKGAQPCRAESRENIAGKTRREKRKVRQSRRLRGCITVPPMLRVIVRARRQ